MLSWKKKTCIIILIPLQAFHLKNKEKTFPKLEGKQKRKRGWWERISAVVKTLQTQQKNAPHRFHSKTLKNITARQKKKRILSTNCITVRKTF